MTAGLWGGEPGSPVAPEPSLLPLDLQEMQFVWRGSRSLLAQQEIFTHVLDENGYCS